MLESSTRPAEKPSTGFLVSSANHSAIGTVDIVWNIQEEVATNLSVVYSG